MKTSNKHQLPKQSFVTSALGELVVRTINHGLIVSRKTGSLIRDGARSFESYIITGSEGHQVGLVGIVGVGRKRATFFCDRERTPVQKEIIVSALHACAKAGAL